MNYILYGNGASGNHGCEAIIRGTYSVLKGNSILMSNNIDEDIRYGIGEFTKIYPAISGKKRISEFLLAYLALKVKGKYVSMDGIRYLDSIRARRSDAKLALSVGGDNYCYGDTGIYEYLNQAYHKNGFKTVLWGCSIEPDVVPQISKDLNRYNLVVARESITYQAISQVTDHIVQAPDPAFFMESQKCELPKQFEKPIIGINISPMIVSYEKNKGMTYENYVNLISYILKETSYNTALVPHVVWKESDDRQVLKRLYEDFQRNERIALIGDHTAPELKYIISKCDLFIGARTHATIAAYSSCVPTLVVGYSVKARGIARDLFGMEGGYVLPVQGLTSSSQLTTAFKKLYGEKSNIQKHLSAVMPDYLSSAEEAKNAIKGLV